MGLNVELNSNVHTQQYYHLYLGNTFICLQFNIWTKGSRPLCYLALLNLTTHSQAKWSHEAG